MNLASIFFDLSHKTDISDWDNTVLDNLVFSDIDSEQRLSLTAEKAMNNPPILNLERSAVIRQYFGKENDCKKSVTHMELHRLLGLYPLVLIHTLLLHVK